MENYINKISAEIENHKNESESKIKTIQNNILCQKNKLEQLKTFLPILNNCFQDLKLKLNTLYYRKTDWNGDWSNETTLTINCTLIPLKSCKVSFYKHTHYNGRGGSNNDKSCKIESNRVENTNHWFT